MCGEGGSGRGGGCPALDLLGRSCLGPRRGGGRVGRSALEGRRGVGLLGGEGEFSALYQVSNYHDIDVGVGEICKFLHVSRARQVTKLAVKMHNDFGISMKVQREMTLLLALTGHVFSPQKHLAF